MVRTLSTMLHGCIEKTPKDWYKALSQFEFAYNCSKHASTGLSPFEVDIGRIHHSPFTRSLADCKVPCQSSFDVVENRKAYSQAAPHNLSMAHARQKFYADRNRCDVSFKVYELVMLGTSSLDAVNRAKLPKKWQRKYLGPFYVTEVTGPVTYKIELPSVLKRAQNVFHVSKLKGYRRPPGTDGILSVSIDPDGTGEQEVRAILNRKRERRRVYYLVQFVGHSRLKPPGCTNQN